MIKHGTKKRTPLDDIAEGYAQRPTAPKKTVPTTQLIYNRIAKGDIEGIDPISLIAYGFDEMQKANGKPQGSDATDGTQFVGMSSEEYEAFQKIASEYDAMKTEFDGYKNN